MREVINLLLLINLGSLIEFTRVFDKPMIMVTGLLDVNLMELVHRI